MTSPYLGALKNKDLLVDAVYEGGRQGNAGDDPLAPLLGVSNQGGFRILGTRDAPQLVVLTTTFSDQDWPDSIDVETGQFVYYGDNKWPGHELHGTRRYGNELLKLIFGLAHSGARNRVPPILAFSSVGTYRDVRFLGLLVPGADGLPFTEDLVAIWRSSGGSRFQNYRAIFTVLDEAVIHRSWLSSLQHAQPLAEPEAWILWKRTGAFRPLKAPRTVRIRSRTEQQPVTDVQRNILTAIKTAFQHDPFRFERCAGRICEMLLTNVTRLVPTRRTADGGRDATGTLRIGDTANGIEVEFALEAKCYAASTPVGVKDVARLISRLRHRQFGILVTTSYVGAQAYKEVKDDGHPIIILAGRDIAEILERNGLSDSHELEIWLKQF